MLTQISYIILVYVKKVETLKKAAPMRGVAVVSGGLDSVTMLYDLVARGDEVEVVSFNYGQRHVKELTCAKTIVGCLGLQHRVIDIPSYGHAIAHGQSSLVDIA